MPKQRIVDVPGIVRLLVDEDVVWSPGMNAEVVDAIELAVENHCDDVRGVRVAAVAAVAVAANFLYIEPDDRDPSTVSHYTTDHPESQQFEYADAIKAWATDARPGDYLYLRGHVIVAAGKGSTLVNVTEPRIELRPL